jgi:hypothetical protein
MSYLEKGENNEEIKGDALDGSNRSGSSKWSGGSAQGLLPFG